MFSPEVLKDKEALRNAIYLELYLNRGKSPESALFAANKTAERLFPNEQEAISKEVIAKQEDYHIFWNTGATPSGATKPKVVREVNSKADLNSIFAEAEAKLESLFSEAEHQDKP